MMCCIDRLATQMPPFAQKLRGCHCLLIIVSSECSLFPRDAMAKICLVPFVVRTLQLFTFELYMSLLERNYTIQFHVDAFGWEATLLWPCVGWHRSEL